MYMHMYIVYVCLLRLQLCYGKSQSYHYPFLLNKLCYGENALAVVMQYLYGRREEGIPH